jgi:hypothetical protein
LTGSTMNGSHSILTNPTKHDISQRRQDAGVHLLEQDVIRRRKESKRPLIRTQLKVLSSQLMGRLISIEARVVRMLIPGQSVRR